MTKTVLQQLIAKRIRLLRLSKHLSQEELSERAELGINYINNIENKFLNIKIETLEKIITALEVTPFEFFNFLSHEDVNNDIDKTLEDLASLPPEKQERILKAITLIIEATK
ncbi:helix-turn-helix domain-containing protein [Streptococcus merionis]|uniref:helix-turn-helix domain-containing protein n=1 Tax=Streptococcus merionis TaxID=400065 RepID=UPI003516080D